MSSLKTTSPKGLTSLKLWNKYVIGIEYVTPVVGGIPVNKNLIEGWLQGQAGDKLDETTLKAVAEATKAQIPGIADEVLAEKGGWNTFKRDTEGFLCTEARCIKAGMKESANILRAILEKADNEGKEKKSSKFTNLRSKVADQTFVMGELIRYTRGGQPIKAVTGEDKVDRVPQEHGGMLERPIHVMTAQGPRTSIKRVEYLNAGCGIEFVYLTMATSPVDDEVLSLFLEHSQYNGMGTADRSQGNGQFRVVKFESHGPSNGPRSVPTPVKPTVAEAS